MSIDKISAEQQKYSSRVDPKIGQVLKEANDVFKTLITKLEQHPLFNDPEILRSSNGDQAQNI